MTRQLMTSISASARAVTAAFALMIGFAALAQAQQILVMSEDRILRESTVGQHIAAELERIAEEMATELEPARTAIAAENEALTAETSALSEEAVRQRPDLVQRLQALQAQGQAYEIATRRAQQELVATERAAMRPVLEVLQGVLREVVEQRGGSILIERANVVFADQSVDITGDAITLMNQRIQTTTVNRVRLPAQNAGAAQQ